MPLHTLRCGCEIDEGTESVFTKRVCASHVRSGSTICYGCGEPYASGPSHAERCGPAREAARRAAFGEGLRAYRSGEPKPTNPYSAFRDERRAKWGEGWRRGWESDPARENDPKVMHYTGPKRHSVATGRKGRT